MAVTLVFIIVLDKQTPHTQISSVDFTSKVPAKVQESMSNQLEQLKIKKDTIESAIAEFEAMK